MGKIKMLKASPFYREYLKKLYEITPGLDQKSYNDQYNFLMAQCFGQSDFWKLNLEKTGHFEVTEIILNAEPLQKTWAMENKVSYTEQNWILDILFAQLQVYQTEVFYAHDYEFINSDYRFKVKKEVSSIRYIFGWDGIGVNDVSVFGGCDMVLSCLSSSADYYTSQGKVGYFFTYGFESSILEKLPKPQKSIDVSFVGSIYLGGIFHNQRFDYLAEMAKETPIQFWSSSSLFQNWQPWSRDQFWRLRNGKWQEFYSFYALGKRWKGEAYGLEMYKVLSQSQMTFNKHIDSAKNEAANMRLFEATGCGTLLITDWKDNINGLFKPEEEIVTYKSINEVVEKTNYYLRNPKKATEIALAGQKRTLEQHSFEKRLTEFAEFLLTQLP